MEASSKVFTYYDTGQSRWLIFKNILHLSDILFYDTNVNLRGIRIISYTMFTAIRPQTIYISTNTFQFDVIKLFQVIHTPTQDVRSDEQFLRSSSTGLREWSAFDALRCWYGKVCHIARGRETTMFYHRRDKVYRTALWRR